MRPFFLLLVLAIQALAQPVSIPKEWKKLEGGAVLLALDAGRYPFLVRRLTMCTIDPRFAKIPRQKQDDVLWEVEKKIASSQRRKPISFLIWDSDLKRYCDELAIDGSTYQVVKFPPLLLAVSFSQEKGLGIAHVYAHLAKDSKIRVNLLPQHFLMAQIQPKLELQESIDPMKIVNKIQSRARWSATLTRLGAAMQSARITTQSTTSSTGYNSGNFSVNSQRSGQQLQGTYSGNSTTTSNTTTTTTLPDYDARARAEAQAQEVERRAEQRAASINGMALRANTLTPGSQIFGAVYFKRDKKAKSSVLAIPIGTVQFEFAVRWQ